jgi:hypothetical protein
MIITKLLDNVNIENEHDFKKRIGELFHDDFIDKVNDDFLKYKYEQEKKLKKENNRIFKYFTYLIMFYNEIIFYINEKYKHKKIEFIKYRINTCEKIYFKSIQTCIDMLSLLEKGALTSSFLLWRSIYNDYVITKFLLKSGEDISECYNEYSRVQKHLLIKDDKDITTEELKEFKKKYGNNFYNNFGWAININGIKNFDKIRKIVKETKYYNKYRFASMYHHSSPFSVNNSIFYGDDKHGNANMLGLFSGNIEIPYNLTISLMKDFTDEMINFFLNDEFGKLISVFNKLLENKFLIKKEKV